MARKQHIQSHEGLPEESSLTKLAAVHESLAKAAENTGVVSPDLMAAIADLERAHDAWLNSVPMHVDLPENDECRAFDAAEVHFITLPCRSYADVLTKVRYLLDGKTGAARIACNTCEVEFFMEFMGSIIGVTAHDPLTQALNIQSAISKLFGQWTSIRDRNYTNLSEAESLSHYAKYRDLQTRIISEEAKSARDLALQLYVDTDGGDSELSKTFSAKIQTLIAP